MAAVETREKLADQTEVNVLLADGFSEVFGNIYSGAIGIGVLVVLALFPLYYRDYYYDILLAKYTFYYVTMLGLFGVLFLITLAAIIIDGMEYRFGHTKAFMSRFSPKEIRKHVLVSDWFLLAFLLVGVISTLQSDYVYEAFWGNEGRYTGLFLHLIYGIGFLAVSHLYRFKKWHMNVFLAVGMLPLLFGITDYFNMDLLGFKWEIDRNDRNSFMSTFGNINTYATYIGMVFGCLSILVVKEKSFWKTVLYVGAFVIASFALIMCNSDNALLAAGLVFALVPLAAFRNRRGVMGYSILLAVFCGAAQVTRWVSEAKADVVIPLEGACRMVANLPGLQIAFLVFLAAAVLFGILGLRAGSAGVQRMADLQGTAGVQRHGGRESGDYGKKFVYAWAAFLLVCVAGGIFVLYDANWGGNSARYGALAPYLHFADEWGTYRGLVWRISMESYLEQPLMHKIWGYGLDTYGVMTMSYRGYTSQICGQVFDSAHNEYLQYLVTIGPIGLVLYLGFLAAVLRRMIKKSADLKWGSAIALGVGCYLLQAMVTINLPIATPIMWMLLSVGAAGCARKVISAD